MDTNIDDKVQIVLKQSPENISVDYVKELLINNEGDVVKTIEQIWKKSSGEGDNILKNIEYNETYKEKEKWDMIRDICNSYEQEMSNFMKSQGYGK